MRAGRSCRLRDTRLLRGERDQNALPGAMLPSITDTRLLRGERDQNNVQRISCQRHRIPNCSGGSEIKTVVVEHDRAATDDTKLLRGERDQNASYAAHGSTHADTKLLRGERDQNSYARRSCRTSADTKLLRGERDQNDAAVDSRERCQIPNCSGGSEIKTTWPALTRTAMRYQIAPGGARSKRQRDRACRTAA